jgi:hypothetical protein
MWVERNNIDQDRLASLDSKLREVIASVIDKVGYHNSLLGLPRKPELNETFRLQNLLEIPHKRLAATDYKWALRTYHLASFYTTLETHLEREQRIDVPLIKDDSPRASRLQRHWKAVFDAFQPTVLLDEAATLLICVTLFPHEELVAYEQVWVENEEAENRGFTDVYWKLRDQFNPESCTAEADKRELAEHILQYAKGALSLSTAENLSLAEEAYLNLEEKKQRIYWPRILGDEVHGGLRQLCVQNDLVLGRVGTRISIPEAMQWFMALFSVLDDKKKSFNRKNNVWKEYVALSLEIGAGSVFPRISIGSSCHMQDLAFLGIKKTDGSDIDPFPNWVPEGKLLVDSICHYTIFLESLRQQICTGVGLRCPFWTGEGCCAFRPLLQRTYEVCNPWHPVWKRHWQSPPCLAWDVTPAFSVLPLICLRLALHLSHG